MKGLPSWMPAAVTPASITATPAAGSAGTELAAQLLNETREELVRVDNKVNTLFAVFGIALAAVLGGILADNWSPHTLAADMRPVWWVGTGFALAGFCALVAAIWPRLEQRHARGHVTYFAHIAQYKRREELAAALARQASTPDARTLEQLHALSSIVMTKYRLIQAGLVFYVLGIVLGLIAALVG